MATFADLVSSPLRIVLVRRRGGPLGEEYYELSKHCPDYAALVCSMKAVAAVRGAWDATWLTRLDDRLEISRATAAEVLQMEYDTDDDADEPAGTVAALPRFATPCIVLEVAVFYALLLEGAATVPVARARLPRRCKRE
jgi:hypothetical protein